MRKNQQWSPHKVSLGVTLYVWGWKYAVHSKSYRSPARKNKPHSAILEKPMGWPINDLHPCISSVCVIVIEKKMKQLMDIAILEWENYVNKVFALNFKFQTKFLLPNNWKCYRRYTGNLACQKYRHMNMNSIKHSNRI